MSDIKTINACGLSCPQPVLLAQTAIKELKNGAIQVLVDSATARDNVTRIAQKSGWSVETEEQPGDVIRITLTK